MPTCHVPVWMTEWKCAGFFVPMSLLPLLPCSLARRFQFSARTWKAIPTVPYAGGTERLRHQAHSSTVGSVTWDHSTSWWARVPSVHICLLLVNFPTSPQSGFSKNLPVELGGSCLCPTYVGCFSFLSSHKDLVCPYFNTGPGGSGDSSGKENIRIG